MIVANGGHCFVTGAGSISLGGRIICAEHQVGPALAVKELDPLFDELMLRR